MEQLTLLPEDSPVSRSALPGSKEARKMTVISGRKLCGFYPNQTPLGSLVRTLLASSVWESRNAFLKWQCRPLAEERSTTFLKQYTHDKKRCFSKVSVKILKKLVTKSRRLLFQLAPSTPRTEEIASGLWPTPRNCTAMAATITPESVWKEGRFPNLETVVGRQMWPTPQARDFRTGEGHRWQDPEKRSRNLNDAAAFQEGYKMWATPNAADAIGSHGGGQGRSLRTDVNGQLNPPWVEWLMGYPEGWTDCEDSETPSCPRSQPS